jgi:hypothetical protein
VDNVRRVSSIIVSMGCLFVLDFCGRVLVDNDSLVASLGLVLKHLSRLDGLLFVTDFWGRVLLDNN